MPLRTKTVRLLLLGAPRLEIGGKPADLDTRKALALLAYLALSPGTHTRHKLAALLWPDADEARAHGALRRTLSVLNTALDGAGLMIEREAVAITPALWLDVAEFRRLAEQAEDRRAQDEAVRLYRDDFMAGFTLRDSPAFDDWQFFQAEALKRELAALLERLVRACTTSADFTLALRYARRWLDLDALHEPVHRHLMQLYAWTGQRAAALRQYQECERILQAELGVRPLEETTRLDEAIRANRLPPPAQAVTLQAQDQPHAAASAPHRPLSRLPLVGRSQEWQQLAEAHALARTVGQMVVLEGEAGIGKTRLAEEFLVSRQAPGAPAPLAVRCYAGQAGLAYGPLIEALRQALAQPEAEARLARLPAHQRLEAARLLPELNADGATLAPLEGPGAQSRFFEGVRQLILALCADAGPGLVFADDLQWADDATAELLAYLARRIAQPPLLLLATWRGEDVPAQHRLRRLLSELQRAGAGRLIRLRRLSPAEVRELAGAALPAAALTGDVLDRLARETEGAPLFLVEYLAALSGQADPSRAWTLPAGVRALLAARLAQPGETGQQVLGAAAVIGRAFDADLLQAVGGRSEDETVLALEELVARGLIVEVASSPESAAYDFGHDKLRSLAYDQISLARRRLLHRRAAEALVARSRLDPGQGRAAPPPVAEIARHYQLGGQEAQAADYFRRAGDHARSLYANADALAYYRAALSLGYPQAADLHEAIGDLQTLAGDYTAALTSYETAASGQPEALARLEHKLANVYDRRGEWDLAEKHFCASASALGETGPAAAQARLYADWSRSAHHAGRAEAAEALAQRALTHAESAADPRSLARAHNVLGILAGRRGDSAQASAHLEHSLQLSETLDDPDARVAALNNLALARREAGDFARAIELTQQALALCTAQGDRHREAALHNNLADLHHALGQDQAALQHLAQAVQRFAEIGASLETGQPGGQPEIWKLTEW